MLKLLLIFTALFIGGCSTRGSVSIDEVNQSITDLERVVTETLPLGKRAQSQNGREFYSEYFTYKNGEYDDAATKALRRTLHVLILGDRRPYKIEARVIVEVRDSRGEYSLAKYDEGMARVFIRRIQGLLNKRRDDRNVIDDFRVF
jgi:hypothetical protein